MERTARRTRNEEAPLQEILMRVCAELRDLAQATEELQVCVSPLIAEAFASRADLWPAVQALDRTNQSLVDLASFVECLSDTIHHTGAPDPDRAAAGMHLADMKSRLLSGMTKPPLALVVAAGEFESF